MAPRGRRGEASEPKPLYKFGYEGRKTGVSLANTGKVDEHGMQPLESIFSSPQGAPGSANGGADDDDDDGHDGHDDHDDDDGDEDGGEDDSDSGSQAMDIPSSAGPGPQTLLKQRDRESRLPRSRSPIKTSLMSSPRRNPAIGSSPTRNDTVTRQLDFSGRASASRLREINGTNGTVDEGGEGAEGDGSDEVAHVSGVRPKVITGFAVSDDEPLPGDEGEPLEQIASSPSPPPPSPPPSQTKRGRPAKDKQPAAPAPQTAGGSRNPQSFRSSSLGHGDEQSESEDEQDRQPKRQRTTQQPARAAPQKPTKKPTNAAAKTASKPKPKGRPGRKPKQVDVDDDDDVGETSFAALQKGPPMPKRPGLVSMRRGPDEVLQTRSGRHSYKPLNWWAGEQVITEDEERNDMFTNDRDFVLGSMKEIVRVEDDEASRARRGPRAGRGRPKAQKPSRAARREEEDIEEVEEPEEWETGQGLVVSEVIAWEPEYETHPPGDDDQVHISEEQIAVSADAVQTKEIRDATFRFAKTLTMPFMGAGIVDLPPGSEKRPKNSRKMHMVFFVHYGKVAVTVNEGHFRISAGGQWFVPRGNYYSISNDYQNPARIFFAQACEVSPQQFDPSESMLLAPGS